MASLNWFRGSSKEAMDEMVKRNCAVLIYIGKENDDFTEVFNDQNIIQLLNNELILCYNMDPVSASFDNFKVIFKDVSFPSLYLIEKENKQHFVIKTNDLVDSLAIHLDLKRQLLNGICCIIKNISETSNVDDKQKYFSYLNNLNTKLQVYNDSKCEVKQVTVVKKSDIIAKIKIRIPSKEITEVQEFPITSSLKVVKTFVQNNYNLSERSLKCIADRQFMDEDFSKTLDELKLCPASTIYFHIEPSLSLLNHKSWFGTLCSAILKPFSFIHQYLMSFIRPPSVEYPRTSNPRHVNHFKKKSMFKPVSNIHTLKNHSSDDDDENNTYNGNSTQQM